LLQHSRIQKARHGPTPEAWSAVHPESRRCSACCPGRSSDSGAWTFWLCLTWRLPGFRQCHRATLVPQYRCASVPDSHRIPCHKHNMLWLTKATLTIYRH